MTIRTRHLLFWLSVLKHARYQLGGVIQVVCLALEVI